MADDVTLLPCKCGAEPTLVHMGYYCYRVCCEACGEASTIQATAAIARKKWNKERMAEMNAVALAERDARIAALEAQLAEARECIDLFNRMIVRAECKWKEAHPDSAFYPDVPDLILWLKEQVDTLAARRCETCAHYDERGWCEINARTYPGNGFCSEWEAADA